MEPNNTFQYTYSAKQQAEIKSIRNKYLAPEPDKLEQLRRLDAGVAQKATAVSLIAGILGALILGLGMSLMMSDLAAYLGISQGAAMLATVCCRTSCCVCVGLVCCARVARQQTF